MSPAPLLDHGLNLCVIKPHSRTSPLRNRAAQGDQRVYGLAHIPQVTSTCRNDACDWLVVPRNDNLLTLRHALEFGAPDTPAKQPV